MCLPEGAKGGTDGFLALHDVLLNHCQLLLQFHDRLLVTTELLIRKRRLLGDASVNALLSQSVVVVHHNGLLLERRGGCLLGYLQGCCRSYRIVLRRLRSERIWRLRYPLDQLAQHEVLWVDIVSAAYLRRLHPFLVICGHLMSALRQGGCC